jgi:RNA polymerase sigma factor (sigma-70 family)
MPGPAPTLETSSSPTEIELLRNAAAGDADAYGRLVSMHQQVAFRAAWHVLGDPAEAEDAAQEAFMKAYLTLGRFRQGSPFRPWLMRIVGNEARNRRRSARRRDALATEQARAQGNTGSQSPADLAVASLERQELLEILTAMSGGDRQVIECRYFLELSELETANFLGCRRGTVKSRLSRAMGRLRAAVKERGLREQEVQSG